MNIICFGDSITEGAEFGASERWPARLQRALERSRAGEWRVHNRGVGGDTTARAFDRFDSDVLPLLPGWLLLQFGFNDANVRDWTRVPRVGVAEFEKNLREFHRLAGAQGGHCVFIVNHTVAAVAGRQGNGCSYVENHAPYERALRALAEELTAPLIDLPRMMRSRDVVLADFVTADGIHLSMPGNALYADMVSEALMGLLDVG